MNHRFTKTCLSLILIISAFQAFAQPGSTIELTNKPKKYENRKLGAEKTGKKKFTILRHGYQNMVTHYNYYFNANNRYNEIIAKAKYSFKEDYTKLLPFYNYTLSTTAQSKNDIDSIIYKCTAGILLHDLRNDWIGDMYLLLGKAYVLRQNFDSANAVFQYINYAFARKDDGYDIPIGSNSSTTDGMFSVATKEKTSFISKVTTHTPIRNDALLWQARNYIETDELSRAAGLLEVLRHDPFFPERLQTDLNENIAYWYYKQKGYDSAALHLSKALDNASDKFEKSRWEFLIAQMYQSAGDKEKAIAFYTKAADHTPDVVMEVYANLDIITLTEGNKEEILQQKLAKLLKLARREKYEQHRDIIYYFAAKLELQMNHPKNAVQLLKRSVANSGDDAEQKNLSVLLLADITYNNKQYADSKNWYDSLTGNAIGDTLALKKVDLYKPALKIIVGNLNSINLQDSLQRIAAMPVAEREAFLKKVLKQQRKLRGIKETAESNNANNTAIANPDIAKNQATSLFNNDTKGDWYFNNNGLKSNGFTQFKQQWGDRGNVDNWRRKADADKVDQAKKEKVPEGDDMPSGSLISPTLTDDLASKLPLSDSLMKKSNNTILKAYFDNGEVFQNKLEDYPAAIDAYEQMNKRLNPSEFTEQSLFNLYYCYTKLGETGKADSCRLALQNNFSKGTYTAKLEHPVKIIKGDKGPATKEYEQVYNLFIEGKFAEAKAEKIKADAKYGDSYWTPQLLFIESIYYVSTKEDSAATNRLNSLASKYPTSPLAARAKTMIDVLARRNEIESYLKNLQITRNEDETNTQVVTLTSTELPTQKPLVRVDSVITKPIAKSVTMIADTTRAAPATVKTFTFEADQPQFVVLLLDQVAPVYASEAKNAFLRYNNEKYYSQKITLTSVKLDDRYNLLLMGPFKDAIAATDYIDKTKPFTAGRILPWLAPDKFSYSLISQANLDLLKDNKDVDSYRKLLQKAMPGKF